MHAIIVLAVIAYALLHLGTGHARYRRNRRRYGHRGVNLYWSSLRRGIWVSVPLPGGFRLGRRIGR